LSAIVGPAASFVSLAWADNVVTVSTSAAHGIPVGDVVPVTIAGATPSAYNGSFNATSTGASTFTYPLVGDPGAETVPGTYRLGAVAELLAMGTTFFAQGTAQGVYVLELGPGAAATGVTALAAYITANPNEFYSWLVPKAWADESTFVTFLAGFVADTSKTYFYTTMTSGNYTSFADIKCVKGLVEAPLAPATEFSLAASFYRDLALAPSSTNKIPPNAFGYLFGVTAYPTKGNGATLAAFKAAGVNYVGTGAEGGISNTLLFWGTTMDGRDFSYWYSVDWVQINVAENVANAVINGSNNPANPLYLNQDGINRLQQVAASTMASAVSFGLALGTVQQTDLTATEFDVAFGDGDFAGTSEVNAVPFTSYYALNPSDYAIGKYAGFSIVYTPARGFTQIIFNVNVTDFVTQ
jgi:hypothetical protein